MVNLSKGCLIASNLQHVLKIFLFKIYKNNVQHVFIDLKIHFLKIPRLMFCKAAFINRWKGKCQKDFQHGQRTEEGLAAIQFGPLFSVSTIIIISIFVLIFFSVNTIIIILIFLMIFFWWYFFDDIFLGEHHHRQNHNTSHHYHESYFVIFIMCMVSVCQACTWMIFDKLHQELFT